MASHPRTPQVGVPVRPVADRVRDYAIICGTAGGLFGACIAARHEAPLLRYVTTVGGGTAFLGGSFIGLREALLQGRWEQDSEAISGFTAGALGMLSISFVSGPRAGVRAGILCALMGSAGHYAHRWWLHTRLQNRW
eukprot:CAMPEP_0115841098 /NCGR_PEP_ID=MMETSP0287-20121206/7115_1 /TAXON_ID=412157 /ORGANISM="Chrysochromulina rotalis, Strain UIO044" /LENGTH=136 /DNA_ID=CAMNT_0003294737 /DNA_START=52 /DNA_END=459 /DNA_ORIENTATION=+